MIIRQGLGSSPPNSALISTGITAAGTVSAATGATASVLAAVGIGAQAVPIVGTIIGGIALLVGALGIGNGCGASCTNSTAIVNKIEPFLQLNLAAAQAQAQANGGCLTSAEQAACVSYFQQGWAEVVQGCGQVGGPGGKQCVQDRQAGGKIDWVRLYLTPIQALPVCAVTPASVTSDVSSEVNSVASSLGINSTSLVYGAIGLFAVALLLGRD
jgi:hypothetical protein